jgi:hypothetical protein
MKFCQIRVRDIDIDRIHFQCGDKFLENEKKENEKEKEKEKHEIEPDKDKPKVLNLLK